MEYCMPLCALVGANQKCPEWGYNNFNLTLVRGPCFVKLSRLNLSDILESV